MTSRRLRYWLASATMLSTAGLMGVQDVRAQVEIEEITVTSRRRAESLQDIPMAITAFTGIEIERGGIRSIDDVARLTPGLTFDLGFGPQDTRPQIRGLPATRGRPPVGILLDGIDVSSESIQTAGGSNMMNIRLLDIERIEVVKGPQSALYGRTAFGGAINYITKRPGDEFRANILVDAGDHGQLEVRGGISGPIDEDGKVGVGVNVAYAEHDGFHRNSVTGEKIGGFESIGGSIVMDAEMSEKLNAHVRLSYSEDDNEVRPQVVKGGTTFFAAPTNPLGAAGSFAPAFGLLSIDDTDTIQLSADPFTGEDFFGSKMDSFISSLKLEYEVAENVLITSLTGYTDAEVLQNFDSDKRGAALQPVFLPPPGGVSEPLSRSTIVDFVTDTRQISQEIRVSDLTSEGFRWAVGGLYWDEKVEQITQSSATVDFAGLGSAHLNLALQGRAALNAGNLDRDLEHLSGYAHVEFDVNDQLTVVAEARYSDDSYTYDVIGSINNAFGVFFFGPVPYSAPIELAEVSASDDYFTPRVSVDYDINDDVMVYAAVAKGAKPGGFSTLSIGQDLSNNRFLPETLWSYEIGVKSQLFDNRVQLNADVFYMDYKNKQVTTQDASAGGGVNLSTVTRNAGEAEIYGFEADIAIAVTEDLTLTGGYAYLDTEYTDFVFTTLSANDLIRGGNCTPTTVVGNTVCEVSLTGNPLERQPKHAFTLGANGSFPITDDLSVVAELSTQYQGKRPLSQWNRWRLPSYFNVDASLSVESDNWSVIAYAENLFDSDRIRSGQENFDLFSFGTAINLFVPDDRQLGVRLSYNM